MRKIAKWVAAIGTAGAVILLGWHLVTYLSIRRTNAANMARAENVKRAFDVANPAGTSADVVNEWLRHRGLPPATSSRETANGDYRVNLFYEKSLAWFCSEESVGLVIQYRVNKVEQSRVDLFGEGCL